MKKLLSVLSLLLVLSFMLSACTGMLQPSTSSEDTSSTASTSSSDIEPDELEGVLINEVVGKNYGGVLAPDGGEYDWIELCNYASTPADIGGWMLSNSLDNIAKFVFPNGTTIAPYSHVVVWAVGKDVTPEGNGFYAPFKISSAGETVILSAADRSVQDIVDVPAVDGTDADWSYGRIVDGGYNWAICKATPMAKNDGSVLQLPDGLFTVSANSGFYSNAFDVSFTVKKGYTLKYTTDCSDPTTSTTASVWGGEKVNIYDPSSDPVRYAKINTMDNSSRYMWAPKEIDKCFVLRIAVVDSQGIASEVSTRCYFVGFDQKDGYSGLPIVCLTSDPDGLYSKNGGLFVLKNRESCWGANVHDTRDWERQTNFAMFDANGQYLFDQEVGIKIRGTSTRGMSQKSLNVYARAEYGSKEFSSEVFGVRTRSIVLRNDFTNLHHLGQGYLQDLISDRDVFTQDSYPVLVFLEGEYYGVYMLYERFSENLVEDRYGIADDNVWTAKKFAGDWGAEFDAPNPDSLLACQKDLNDILAYIRDHDMSQKKHYDYVCSKIDMDSLIDLLCFQLYIGNVDFSLAQNISAWRAIEPDPTNPYADGKWRFVVYDLDISMIGKWNKLSYNVESNPFTDKQPWAGGGFLDFTISTCYFNLSGDTLVKDTGRRIRYDFSAKMMTNADFCQQFVRTMEDMGNFNFAPERVKAALDEQLALIAPVYATYRKRVVQDAYENTAPDVDEQLIANLMGKYNSILDYFNRRYAIISEYMAEAFQLSGSQKQVDISISGAPEAQIKVSTSVCTVDTAGISALYYSDYDLSVTAMNAPEGYIFDHWEVQGGQITEGAATDETVAITMTSGSVYVTAVYKRS